MSSQFFIQTRGRQQDYCFLIRGPQEQWWRSYRDYTAFERPTIIVERSDGRGRVYLSGIPSSSRRDFVNTIIRYTLVAEFNGNEDRLYPFIKSWLEEIAAAPNSRPAQSDTGERLDQIFPEEWIEPLISNNSPTLDFDQLQQKLVDLMMNGSTTTSIDPAPQGVWWGGLQDPTSRDRWMSLVADLLTGTQEGAAFLLNLADSQDLLKIAPGYSRKALLLTDFDAKPTPLNTQGGKKNWILYSLIALALVSLVIALLYFSQSAEYPGANDQDLAPGLILSDNLMSWLSPRLQERLRSPEEAVIGIFTGLHGSGYAE